MKKRKLGKPNWLEEMFETGRLSRKFNPSAQVIVIKDGKLGETKIPNILITLNKVVEGLEEFRKEMDGICYFFDPKKGEIRYNL